MGPCWNTILVLNFGVLNLSVDTVLKLEQFASNGAVVLEMTSFHALLVYSDTIVAVTNDETATQ